MNFKMILDKSAEFLIQKIPWLKQFGIHWIKRIIIGVFSLIIILLLNSIFRTKDRGQISEWTKVKRGSFSVELVESGDVESVSQVTINAPMMWGANLQVIDVVEEGTIVQKGDTLIQFDVSDLESDKTLAEDNLESLMADLEKIKAQQALTLSNMENSLRLSNYSFDQAKLRLEIQKYESEAKQEEARLQLKQAEINLEKTKKQVKFQKIIHQSQLIQEQTSIREAENDLESLNNRIAKFKLQAPTDGLVVYIQNRGERVRKGYTARPGRSLLFIPDLSHMQVKLYINEVDRQKVRPYQKASITLDAYPDLKFQGSISNVSRLAQQIDGEEQLKGFVVYVDIQGSDERLKPGMTAKVSIVLVQLENVMSVPVGSVFEIDGQPVVFPKGKEKPYAVYLGPRNDGFVVIERGVNPDMLLSWKSPIPQAVPLGTAEEKRRIAAVNQTLQNSFKIFEDRGILFKYRDEFSEEAVSDSKSDIDLSKLSPALRKRLENQETEGAKPKLEVGQSESGQRKGTFKVSPEMMKRLEKKKTEKKENE